MGHPIGTLPRTPFPASRDFPSRGNERYEEKTGESYASCTTPAFSPPWWLALPPFPHFVVALWVLSNGIMSLQKSIECFILLPLAGEVPRSEPIRRMLIMPYDTDSQSRNAGFILFARRAIHNPQRRRRCRPLSEANHNPSTQPAAEPRPFFKNLRRSRHHHPQPVRAVAP